MNKKLLIIGFLILTISCSYPYHESRSRANLFQQENLKRSYIPYWGNDAEYFSDWDPSSIGYLFYWASSSPDLATAQKRWEKFLKDFEPGKGGFDDSLDYNCVHRARLELMRIYYLQGMVEAGDRIIREYDPDK